MQVGSASIAIGSLLLAVLVGCRSQENRRVVQTRHPQSVDSQQIETVAFEPVESDGATDDNVLERLPLPSADIADAEIVSPERLKVQGPTQLELDEVVESIRVHFPLIRVATAARGVAAGETLSAQGAFDHKLEGLSYSQPLDFYENYRQSIGVKRETMWGGQTFASYRIGRGDFEPWYLERQTNAGGEFRAGFLAPLMRDRWIDANRAELWRAQLEQRRVEPEIMAQIILFVRDGSVAYWNWVAAGANFRIAEGLLDLAIQREGGLEAQVEAQEKSEIDLIDNRRIIVSREAKLIDARRKLEQAGVKLSLFYRSENGEPVLPDATLIPVGFDRLTALAEDEVEPDAVADDAAFALAQRPELAELQVVRQQLRVALRQANNETWPDVDGGFLVAQDVGAPTSAKRDKSELQLQALISISVPLERRKAIGKVRSLQSKLAKLNAKYQFSSDKVVADVRLARIALSTARQRVVKARQSVDLALQMQQAEEELFNEGQSTLFNLNIREQQAAEAAVIRVQALLDYFIARADYSAALGYDRPAP